MGREETLDTFVRPTEGNNMAPDIIEASASHRIWASKKAILITPQGCLGNLTWTLEGPVL